MKSGLHVALEVKGFAREKDDFKKAAGLKWAQAVNNYYGARRWAYEIVYDPASTATALQELDGTSVDSVEVADQGQDEQSQDSPPDAALALLDEGESSTVEFKQSLEYVDPGRDDIAKVPDNAKAQKLSEAQRGVLHSALKTICAFLNSRGGTLLLGVADDGSIIGIEPDYTLCGRKQDRDGFENKLTDLLKTRITPIPADVDIRYITVDSKTICRVMVPKEKLPHYLDNKLYVRLGNSTEELTGRDFEDWLRRSS